ncbi:Hypothetical predicted protein [Olea europaea subsp. europaea]|nr:Hypothetical predicted protein [Olea europaea subsp. europaea]
MADVNSDYACAVVDEIQMLGCRSRGFSFTRALLGISAEELHLCGDAAAVPLIQEILKVTDDIVKVQYYERLSPLVPLKIPLGSFANIKTGDCIVTFSRREIYRIKKQIENGGKHLCSVVYGSLPPETRARQATMFNDENSELDVLVASDAIGMGLNLNISRIIFSTLKKFDGVEMRDLSVSEIKQIAGRAGRYRSKFPVGEVTCLDAEDLPLLNSSLSSSSPIIEQAGLFPSFDLLFMYSRLHPMLGMQQILEHFLENAKLSANYFITDCEEMLGLTQFAHSYSKNGIVRLREIFTPRTLKVPKTQTALKELESVHKVDFPVQGIMEQKPRMLVPRLKLGTQGLEVSKLGFGCGGLSGILNAPLSHEAGCAILKEAFNMGITFFDTADRYGQEGDNEIMIGKALKELPREQVQLASKFGIYKMDFTQVEVKGTPKYVRQCIEASLKRLNVDYIDLYYPHRIDISVPIEETMWELKKLVEEGKIRYIGLSEASVDTIRRAHAVHPITAVEMEYSLWTREIEEDVIPLCRELGIGIVAYSPLGHGFFAGKAIVESLPSQSVLDKHPRFVGENLEKNKVLYARFANLAAKHSCTPPQLALAWLLHRGDDVVPIPGTTKIKNLIDNINSLAVKLTPDDLKEIADAIPIDQVAGEREVVLFSKYNYKLANTPLEKEKLSSSQNTTIN